MRKVLILSLLLFSIVALSVKFGSLVLSKNFNLRQRTGIRVQANKEVKVYINQKEVGVTPYASEDFPEGEHFVKIGEGEAFWQGYVRLNPGTWALVNRELSEGIATGSGEIITLEKGSGAMIVSDPDASDVEVDSKPYGKTPLLVTGLGAGEHVFMVSHGNFLKKSIKAQVIDGYRLNLKVDLAISEVEPSGKTPFLLAPKMVTVKVTPTGFLRVRSKPVLNAPEIARVLPGDSLEVLEELPSWFKVELSDGKEGYVASVYVTKSQPPQ